MKIKLLVKIAEMILGKAISDDEPRADMYLPIRILAFGLLLLAIAIVAGVYAAIKMSLVAAIAAVVCLGFGISAVLCWKNQTINIISEDSFEYSTFLGKITEYRFSEIRGLRRNKDSMTLFVGEGKVHIESSAIITPRLAERINKQLAALHGENR